MDDQGQMPGGGMPPPPPPPVGGPIGGPMGGPGDDPHDEIIEALRRIEDKLAAIAAKLGA
mgnify:CR=1 FL=1